MTRRQILILIPLVILLLNGVGYLVLVKSRPPATSGPPEAAAPHGVPARPSAPNPSPAPAPQAQSRPADGDARREAEETARLRRESGLSALEAGEYDKALIDFTEAKALLGDKANVADLIRVTQDLRNHPRSASHPRTPPPAPPRSASRPSNGHRVAVRETPNVEEAPPAQAPPAAGLLIVTTTPHGLLVQVDDASIDLTPMRTKLRPGNHRVALLDGDRKVYETTVDVKEGATTTLLKDLPSEAPADSARDKAEAPTPPVTATANEEHRRPEPAVPTPAVRPPAPPPRLGPDKGGLSISSPGLYGVVWVNGRPRGYPPLDLGDLPAGPTKIEIRINGVQKRSSTVDVKPGLTTSVKLLSQENR